MLDMKKIINNIAQANFFSTMESFSKPIENTIYIQNVFRAFIEPLQSDFKGTYETLEWLPTAPTQSDPFNSFSQAFQRSS